MWREQGMTDGAGSSGLSVEQRKRLTIAVELVANPSIVFMDEPTSGLDARAAAIVMRAVRNTVDTGRTVVGPRPFPALPSHPPPSAPVGPAPPQPLSKLCTHTRTCRWRDCVEASRLRCLHKASSHVALLARSFL